MLGIIYAVGWLFGVIKSTIKDVVEDTYGRTHRRIGDRFYVNGTKLMDMETGHQVYGYGDHKYYDFSTGEYFRTPPNADDIKKEEENKVTAKQWGFSVYRISNARLPANVEGVAYKDFNNGRLYISRKIYQRGSLMKYPKYIKGTFLISLNPDNYGKVERHFGGRELEPMYAEAFKHLYIDPTKSSWCNDEFGWSKN